MTPFVPGIFATCSACACTGPGEPHVHHNQGAGCAACEMVYENFPADQIVRCGVDPTTPAPSAPAMELEWRRGSEVTLDIVRGLIERGGVDLPECHYQGDPGAGRYVLFLFRPKGDPRAPGDLPFIAPVSIVTPTGRGNDRTEPYLIHEDPDTGDPCDLADWPAFHEGLVAPVTLDLRPLSWPEPRAPKTPRAPVFVPDDHPYDILAAILDTLELASAAYCVRRSLTSATPSIQHEIATRAPMSLRKPLAQAVDLWDRIPAANPTIVADLVALYDRLP